MDECTGQQSLKDLCGKEHAENIEQMSETEREAHVYPIINCPEKNGGKHSEYSVSDGICDMTDDYCFLRPADNSSGLFTNDLSYVLQASGEVTKTDTDEEWCATTDVYNSEYTESWQENNYELSSESHDKNLYVPLPVHSTTGDLPTLQYDRGTTASLLPGDNLPLQPSCSQEEEICKEGNDGEYNEELVTVTSTEDDVYIIFETSSKSLIDQNPATSGAIPNPATERGASNITIGKSKDHDDDENVLYSELDNHSDGENYNERDEEDLVVASTEDNVYIVFETSIKDKQRGQKTFIDPPDPEDKSNCKIESNASYIAQAEGRDDCIEEPYFWDEINEDPYSLAYADDDLYIELPLETTDREPTGRKSFIVHRAPAPAPRPQQQQAEPNIEDSYITRVFRQKEKEKNIYGTDLYQEPEVQGRAGSFWPAGANTNKVHTSKPEAYVPPQQCVPSGQDELIMLQEQVKLGIISVDEALHKFHQWQNEKSGLDLLQQKKLQQLRDNIIGDKPDDDKVYDKITIVHQPNAFPAKHRGTAMFDSSIYQKPQKPAHHSQYPLKRDNGTSGKLPFSK